VIGLSLNTVYKIDANKDTLVDPSSGNGIRTVRM